jgi:hypothetical protein
MTIRKQQGLFLIKLPQCCVLGKPRRVHPPAEMHTGQIYSLAYFLKDVGHATPVHKRNRVQLFLRALLWLGDVCGSTDAKR